MIDEVVSVIVDLLHHRNPHIREAAADAIGQIGLPHGQPATSALYELVEDEAIPEVRDASAEALGRLVPVASSRADGVSIP